MSAITVANMQRLDLPDAQDFTQPKSRWSLRKSKSTKVKRHKAAAPVIAATTLIEKKGWFSLRRNSDSKRSESTLKTSSVDIDALAPASETNAAVKQATAATAATTSWIDRLLSKRTAEPEVAIIPPVEKKLKKKDSKKGKKEITEKPEDVERNTRHEAVMSIVNGKRELPAMFTERYEIGDVLGDGAFGFVCTGSCRTSKREVAVKFIVKSKIPDHLWVKDRKLGRIPREVQVLSSFRNPFVIGYVDHAEDDDYFMLVTELHGCEWTPSNPKLNPAQNPGLRHAPVNKSAVDNSESSPLFRLTVEQQKELEGKRRTSVDLFECIDSHTQMDVRVVKHIFAQIALAVYYLHSRGYVHRDLKDENIVIDENYNLKLIDFGSAARIPTTQRELFTKFNGTAHFASPEIARGCPYRGPEAEIWALGVLLFTILFGENPFSNRVEILSGRFTYPRYVDEDCVDLLDSMLRYDEKERFTIDEVVRHDWIATEIDLLSRQNPGAFPLW